MASPRNSIEDAGSIASGTAMTAHELRAHVRAYCSMLERELRGHRRHRHRLVRERESQGDGVAEEVYHQIAGILIGSGLPFLDHYAPSMQYPRELRTAVETFIRNHPELLRLMEADVDAPADPVPDLGGRRSDAIACDIPAPGDTPEPTPDADASGAVSGIDFLAREQRNPSLARAGERFVLRYEMARLREAGCRVYADAVEHVAAEQGAGAGFDIHSYDADGRDRYIKVKTTRYRRETPFFVTANEIAMAENHREHFWVYRVFGFRAEPKLYALNGSLQGRFRLDPIAYRARPR